MRDVNEIDMGRVDEQASAEAEERGRLSRKDLDDGVFKVREALDDVALLPVDEEDVSVATCGSKVCHFRKGQHQQFVSRSQVEMMRRCHGGQS